MGNRSGFAPDEFYHLYNRGTEKRNIFSNKGGYERFLSLLYLCNSTKQVHTTDIIPRGLTSWKLWEILKEFDREETLVDICAYCLMPNHFHLLVREKTDNNISRFMQKLMTGYTMYFNMRHERTGTLFQGTFKSTHVDDDQYLKYLIAYIHLNPIKLIEPRWKETGITDKKRAEYFLEKYQYSSYTDFHKQGRPEQIILAPEALPEYFESPTNFKKSITEWLDYQHSNTT